MVKDLIFTQPGHGLYVHWPWCKKKCPYCDFNSHVAATIPEEAYLETLLTEMGHLAHTAKKMPITSVFFGGGTPSLMAPQTVETILNKAQSLFDFAPDVEITLEANPTSSEAKKFKGFAQAGVNRFSVGMQSLNPDDLAFLGREHTKHEAQQAVEDALKATNNVSLDLIYGLPNQNLDLWQQQLEKLLPLGTSHISCYQLTLEKNTAFYADFKKGRLNPMPADLQADFYKTTTDLLGQHGYNQYEVSNYARDGKNCIHNQHIWRYGSYMGLGAGAHGRVLQPDGTRLATRNYKMPKKYMDMVAQQNHGQYEALATSPNEQGIEALLMGIRLTEGVPLKRLEDLSQTPWQNLLDESGIQLMQTNGFLKGNPTKILTSKNTLEPTPQGLLMLESVLGYILR